MIMTTIKSYTDIEQSKVLAEILSNETSDMYYWCGESIRFGGYKAQDKDYDVPCWSLAALLSVIPKHIKDYNVLRIDISDKDFAIWYDEIGYGVNNELPNITEESAIDACYKMILRLKEKNLI
jgi:hypothetical protein